MTDWTYRVFGLTVCVPREVATLNGAAILAEGPPDVRVVFGTVPPRPVQEIVSDDLEVSCEEHGMTINIDEVGRFLIRNGDSIVVAPAPEAGLAEVDLYLAGSVMGAVLHQRGVLPLHCNAFACADQAVLICGDSGAGKSTLAAWLEGRGHSLLTDDVCAVTMAADGQPIGHPGMPRLRLWEDAIEAMKRGEQSVRTIPWAPGKFELEMGGQRVKRPLPIAAIYHLDEAETDTEFAITQLSGLEAIDAVTRNIYRRRIGDLVGRAADYLRESVHIAQRVPVFRVNRTWGLEHMEAQAEKISLHCERLCRNGNGMNVFSLMDD